MNIKTEWKENVKRFYMEWYELGLNNIQLEILNQICDQLQICELAKDNIKENGITFLSNMGAIKKNPSCEILATSSNTVTKLLRLLSDTIGEEE